VGPGVEAGWSSAYLHWDSQWRERTGILAWTDPEPWVAEIVDMVCRRGSGSLGRALDIGCGVGRHTLLMARRGLQAHGMDRSEAGLRHVREQGERLGLAAHLCTADFRQLPFGPGTFDYVLAWNTIYHGTEQDCAAGLTEIRRVTRPGGLFQATMLSKRNREYGRGIEIHSNTFVQAQATDDKVHPHTYSDEPGIARLYQDFRMLAAVEREHGDSGSYHWHLLCEVP